jgi:hypothetical protein
MKRIVAAIIFTLLPIISFSADNDRSTTVRDSYGDVAETRDRYGDDTTVRDKYGDIIRTERYEDGQTIIRDGVGNIIGTEEND